MYSVCAKRIKLKDETSFPSVYLIKIFLSDIPPKVEKLVKGSKSCGK